MNPNDWQEFQQFLEFKKLQREREAHQATSPPDEKGPTVRELFELYRPLAERRKSWPSVGRCHWMHLLKFFGDFTVAELDHDKGDEYQRFRLSQKRLVPDGKGGMKPGKKNIQPATVNNELNSMRALLNWCMRRQKIARNPFTDHRDLEVEPKRRFHCAEADFLKILEHAPPVTRLMLILSYETGMRRDEFRLLQWTEVNLQSEPATITLPPGRVKGGKNGRTIVLSKLAADVIKSAPRMTPSKFVFPNPKRNDGSEYPRGTLCHQFMRARERAGVKGPGDQNYWIHSLRKSYATNKAVSGMPVYMLMEQLGHSSHEVHREYTKLSPDHLLGVAKFLDMSAPRMGPRPIEEREREQRRETPADDALREFVRKKE